MKSSSHNFMCWKNKSSVIEVQSTLDNGNCSGNWKWVWAWVKFWCFDWDQFVKLNFVFLSVKKGMTIKIQANKFITDKFIPFFPKFSTLTLHKLRRNYNNHQWSLCFCYTKNQQWIYFLRIQIRKPSENWFS